jgi:hypothetical protein
MKTGPQHSSDGLKEGIHWHINSDVQIDYLAADYKRELIPWVRYINLATGDTVIFEDGIEPLSGDAKDTLVMRMMDCMDCHNRPSHNYLTPATFVNNALANGEIATELPGIKGLAMEIFTQHFVTTDSALNLIEQGVWDFYVENYPEVIAEKPLLLKKAVKGLQKGFEQNMFPEMNANWDDYPDHIGHMEFNGCFRCHDDKHRNKVGEVISRDCNLCHNIMLQGNTDSIYVAKFNDSLEFKHPVDIDGAWKEIMCSECHRYLY